MFANGRWANVNARNNLLMDIIRCVCVSAKRPRRIAPTDNRTTGDAKKKPRARYLMIGGWRCLAIWWMLERLPTQHTQLTTAIAFADAVRCRKRHSQVNQPAPGKDTQRLGHLRSTHTHTRTHIARRDYARKCIETRYEHCTRNILEMCVVHSPHAHK